MQIMYFLTTFSDEKKENFLTCYNLEGVLGPLPYPPRPLSSSICMFLYQHLLYLIRMVLAIWTYIIGLKYSY